jgi:RNA polymerase sigma-70 factor (ECF subfamily)
LDRAAWLAQHVVPIEAALRSWLCRHRLVGLEIDDVVQETYAILAALKSVEDIRNPRQYAFKVAYSIVLASARRSKLVAMTPLPDADGAESIAEEPSPETLAGDREELLRVIGVVGVLPEKVKQVFILRRIHGLSQREVAQRLGVTENVVEKYVAKGLEAVLTAFKRGGNSRAESPRIREGAMKTVFPLHSGKKWV